MKKIVKRFAYSEKGEDGKYTHWIEYTDGTREVSTPEKNHFLWYKWVSSKTSKEKYNENGFTIFEF